MGNVGGVTRDLPEPRETIETAGVFEHQGLKTQAFGRNRPVAFELHARPRTAVTGLRPRRFITSRIVFTPMR